jgi:electron transfer flavoprotein alpha subunit
MAILVIAEHDNQSLKAATLNTLGAAQQLSAKGAGDIVVLVAGSGCGAVAEAAAKIAGVAKILVADDAGLEHGLAENLTAVIMDVAADFSHILAPATTFGKNVLPRVAALLDVQQISEISAVEDADTFVRPIYAGNAMATVKSSRCAPQPSIRFLPKAAAPQPKPCPAAPTRAFRPSSNWPNPVVTDPSLLRPA